MCCLLLLILVRWIFVLHFSSICGLLIWQVTHDVGGWVTHVEVYMMKATDFWLKLRVRMGFPHSPRSSSFLCPQSQRNAYRQPALILVGTHLVVLCWMILQKKWLCCVQVPDAQSWSDIFLVRPNGRGNAWLRPPHPNTFLWTTKQDVGVVIGCFPGTTMMFFIFCCWNELVWAWNMKNRTLILYLCCVDPY